MESGEGAGIHPTAKKGPIEAVKATLVHAKHRLTKAWLGEGEGPDRPDKRKLFKKTLGIAAVSAIAAVENAAAVRALVTGTELITFADNAPNFREHPHYSAAMREAEYKFSDSAVFEDRDSQGEVTDRYVPVGYISFGDSLAYGFVENYDSSGRLIIDQEKMQACPTDTLCAAMNAAGVITNAGIHVDFEGDNKAYIGASTADIAGQIQQFNHDLGDHPEKFPPLAFDTILAVGGNNALNYLASSPSADIADNFRTEFIEKEFKENMRTLINTIIGLRTQGKDSPVYKNMKHLIVSGVPDLGKSDTFYYIPSTDKPITKPEDIPPAIAIPMNPVLKGITTAACKYMNYAILDVIAEVQIQHPDLPILFEDIFGVPVHGIHPTAAGYGEIAIRREQRSRATFYAPPDEETAMTYRQYIEQQQEKAKAAKLHRKIGIE